MPYKNCENKALKGTFYNSVENIFQRMNKKNQETTGAAKIASARKWADEVVAIAENPSQGGIEIRFNAEPSPQLQPKLRVMGFRHSRSMTMWYGDNTTQAFEFAERVKKSLRASPEGPDLFLSPSYDAVKSNIEKKEFSFILITLKDGQVKNFIVFEPSKPRAEVIALNFAKQKFDDKFLALAAKPKTLIREARILFDENKIIGANEGIPRQKTVYKDRSHFKEKSDVEADQEKIPQSGADYREKAKKETRDPLANESGVYTGKSAGENYEEIIIPMPKGAQYEAGIRIVKTSKGDYRKGMSCSKKFGDGHGGGYMPSQDGETFPTRKDAITSALKEINERIKADIKQKDTILDNEEKKNKSLNMALEALSVFAEENGISLEAPSEASEKIQLNENPLSQKSTVNSPSSEIEENSNADIIKGLEAAYWTQEDKAYPANKVLVNGMTIQQARLRNAISKRLQDMPLPTLLTITDELSKKFKERRPLDAYEKGYVTIGKTGDKRKAALIAMYIDDMIIDNDLKDNPGIPVMSFLVKRLYDNSEKLVDLPQQIEKQSLLKMKKQSQHELNKEIEAFIEKKDKEGSSFNPEEKNYIRQYTGSGGLIKEGAVGRGVLYEYYTPETVVQKMWGMAFKYGYDGGSVLEPAVGTGNFLKYAPKDAIVSGYETNHFSARIAQILFPHAQIHEKAFESLFFAGNIHLKDNFDYPPYSLVIGNPPYGDFTGKYAGMGEKQWTGATEYDQYFILRGLDLLKKGGLLIYVVPSSFLTNNIKSAKAKEKIASKVDFMDAYRLPIRTFETTDIGTDIVLFRKK